MNFIYKGKVSFWLRIAVASALSKNPTETTIKKKIKAYNHKNKENERENNRILETRMMMDKWKYISRLKS